MMDCDDCISDKTLRYKMAAEAAQQHQTTTRRILRLYYRYLATGRLTQKRTQQASKSNQMIERAIRRYYFGAKRLSLRSAYEMMLLEDYVGPDGRLDSDAPTWSKFRHYYYGHRLHKDPQKIIAREGLTKYQRDHRPAWGTSAGWRSQPGSYQMDSTQADIYLVSRQDRSIVVGRPYIYLAVDTATHLIAGVYVGYSCDETAVMACIAQAASDKVEYCARYGIEITQEQWPSVGMPTEIITDQGREFFGPRMSEMCRRYGLEVLTLPPFRPDQKGCVEKSIDLLQQRYKPMLRGRGVIEEDAQERWATDYRTQATLDLDDFTRIVIHSILYLTHLSPMIWLKCRLRSTGSCCHRSPQSMCRCRTSTPSMTRYTGRSPRHTVRPMWWNRPGRSMPTTVAEPPTMPHRQTAGQFWESRGVERRLPCAGVYPRCLKSLSIRNTKDSPVTTSKCCGSM